ncbi:hypothetical protein [Imtechella halotolerans]|nr:hypothetical protein [Imtechella halotolerans]WMQ62388.1 membrane metalloprotease [Imtechella halotolerans]
MKKLFRNSYLVYFFLLLTISCSKDNEDNGSENGTNPIPNQQLTGSSANDFLSASKYDKIAFEIVYVEGYKPSTTSINNLLSFFNELLHKPQGVTITERAIPSPGNGPYTIQEIVEIEKKNRTKFNNVNELALYAFFADSNYNTDNSTSVTLGTAYRNTSFVIFENTIIKQSNRPGAPSRPNLETAVLQHEFGHLLGLVDFGSDMQEDHLDKEHGFHCNVSTCLMFWQIESNLATSLLNGEIPKLDAHCLADLRANGGK